MKSIPQYEFHKTKYGEELLIDVVTLDGIRRYIDRHPVHTLSYFDITFITAGSGRFSLGDRPYALRRGDVVFSRPGEVRAWDGVPQGYALIFEEEFLLSFFSDRSFLQNLSYFNRDRVSAAMNVAALYTRIEGLIGNVVEEIDNERSKDKHILRALLYEILTLLDREYRTSHAAVGEMPRNRYADRFAELVGRNFKTRHDTKYYADALCITPNYLNGIVQKQMGIGPKAYIRDKIMQEAKVLLCYTGLSVSQIAAELNFEDPAYFIRLFRRRTGLTPLQYRQGANR